MQTLEKLTTLDGGYQSIRICVSPPAPSRGIAEMLVALGDAHVAVDHVATCPDNSGRYVLTMQDSATVYPALQHAGCRVHWLRSPAWS